MARGWLRFDLSKAIAGLKCEGRTGVGGANGVGRTAHKIPFDQPWIHAVPKNILGFLKP